MYHKRIKVICWNEKYIVWPDLIDADGLHGTYKSKGCERSAVPGCFTWKDITELKVLKWKKD